MDLDDEAFESWRDLVIEKIDEANTYAEIELLILQYGRYILKWVPKEFNRNHPRLKQFHG